MIDKLKGYIEGLRPFDVSQGVFDRLWAPASCRSPLFLRDAWMWASGEGLDFADGYNSINLVSRGSRVTARDFSGRRTLVFTLSSALLTTTSVRQAG